MAAATEGHRARVQRVSGYCVQGSHPSQGKDLDAEESLGRSRALNIWRRRWLVPLDQTSDPSAFRSVHWAAVIIPMGSLRLQHLNISSPSPSGSLTNPHQSPLSGDCDRLAFSVPTPNRLLDYPAAELSLPPDCGFSFPYLSC